MTTSYKKWQRVVQRVKMNDNEWHLMTTSCTTNNNKWYIEWQLVAINENEWQRVVISANFSVFRIGKKPTTKHPKENSSNLEEELEECLLN